MKHLFCTLILFAFVQLGSAQQFHLLDIETKRPVAYAQIFNEKGAIVGTTDIKGLIPEAILQHKQTLFIQHISYKTLELPYKKWEKATVIYIEPMSYKLEEVSAQARQIDYIYLKGYFRSYQLNDSVLKYYVDGIAEFYIPLKGKSDYRKITELRVMQNEELVEKQIEKSMMIYDTYVAIVYLEPQSLIEEVRNDKKYELKDDATTHATNILCKGEIAGSITQDATTNTQCIELDALAPKDEKVLKMFGFTQRLTVVNKVENNKWNKNHTSRMDLLNTQMYRQLFYKHKKQPREQQSDVFDDFIVLDRAYMTKEEMKTSRAAIPKHTPEFWKLPQVPALSAKLEDVLNTKMIQVKKFDDLGSKQKK